MGGNGFVEDFPMARLFRQSPLNAIWEGSGNVIALDVLRGLKAVPLLLREIKLAQGMDATLDGFVGSLEKTVLQIAKSENVLSDANQRQARNLIDRLAMALQASALLRIGDPTVSY